MDYMKEIGGYFELELSQRESYHQECIKLNSGRNAFKYVLKSENITKVYVPNYICDSIIEPLKELKINYEFYNINDKFEIIQDIEVKASEKLFYVNYYALKSKYIQTLALKYGDKLIIDNCQAFYEQPIKGVKTIYSPRKFFGVSDGGYVYTSNTLNSELETDESYQYTLQLIGRSDKCASSFYNDFQKAEKRLDNQPIKMMSNFTSKMLNSIDYEAIKVKRTANFLFLHKELKKINLLDIEMFSFSTPFIYPFFTNKKELRDMLIKNKIYIAQYWDEVLHRDEVSDIETDFVKKMLPLPIDQRYDIKDMKRIIDVIGLVYNV